MKINSKALILAVLFLLSVNFVSAQRGQWNSDPAERARQQTTEMTEKLALSTKQSEKVGEINLKYANKMKEARDSNPEGDWPALRETMMTLRQGQDKELKNVMTAAQFEQWEKIQEERRSQMQERRSPRPSKEEKPKTRENKG